MTEIHTKQYSNSLTLLVLRIEIMEKYMRLNTGRLRSRESKTVHPYNYST